MKIYILPDIIEGPFGGGNQFVKALRELLRSQQLYADSMSEADVVILNGYPFRDLTAFRKVIAWKQKAPARRRIITRVDGPIALGRNNPASAIYDEALYAFCETFADGAIVQSQWSLGQMKLHPLFPSCPMTVIGNAPNPDIFFPPDGRCKQAGDGKFKVIATTWSTNPQKGFPVYQWLDTALDFSRYEFTIVGAKDQEFENIQCFPAMPQSELAALLRQSDIYLTASRVESCSNAALEALHCGLPSVAPNDTSYPEYMSNTDLLFNDEKEIPALIDRAAKDLDEYRRKIAVKSLSEIKDSYVAFADDVQNTMPRTFASTEARAFVSSYSPRPTPVALVKQFVKARLPNAFF